MAKIRKSKLSWATSESDHVVGYRLYWSNGNEVDYDCSFIEIGNVTEVFLPEVLNYDPSSRESFMLGITAVDKTGNESDILRLPLPYKAEAPLPPKAPLLTKLDAFIYTENQQQVTKPVSTADGSEAKVKYYDDVGFRRLDIDKTPTDSDCVVVKEND